MKTKKSKKNRIKKLQKMIKKNVKTAALKDIKAIFSVMKFLLSRQPKMFWPLIGLSSASSLGIGYLLGRYLTKRRLQEKTAGVKLLTGARSLLARLFSRAVPVITTTTPTTAIPSFLKGLKEILAGRAAQLSLQWFKKYAPHLTGLGAGAGFLAGHLLFPRRQKEAQFYWLKRLLPKIVKSTIKSRIKKFLIT